LLREVFVVAHGGACQVVDPAQLYFERASIICPLALRSGRTREIGLRMPLGARGADAPKLAAGQGMNLTLTGVTFSLVASVALTRTIKNLLFGVSAAVPVTFAAIRAARARSLTLPVYPGRKKGEKFWRFALLWRRSVPTERDRRDKLARVAV
jgi:hypothetical protein